MSCRKFSLNLQLRDIFLFLETVCGKYQMNAATFLFMKKEKKVQFEMEECMNYYESNAHKNTHFTFYREEFTQTL